MNNKLLLRSLGVVLALFFGGSFALADSPKSTVAPDRHSVEVKGKVSLYRAQIQDMKLGEGANQVDAEVFVSLDSKPGVIYALQIKRDSPPANKIIADTLRDAYINKLPVTLYHQISVTQDNNYKILMVQLN